jgi:hypothetical protein
MSSEPLIFRTRTRTHALVRGQSSPCLLISRRRSGHPAPSLCINKGRPHSWPPPPVYFHHCFPCWLRRFPTSPFSSRPRRRPGVASARAGRASSLALGHGDAGILSLTLHSRSCFPSSLNFFLSGELAID